VIEPETHIVPTKDIEVPPGRQRRDVPEKHIEDLSESIMDHGLFHPIILRRDNSLVIGECRLKAWKRIERLLPAEFADGIPARYTDEIDPNELKSIELQENLQRENLTWQDESLAFLEFYEAKKALAEDETYDDDSPADYTWAMMSGDLKASASQCRRMVQVGRAVLRGDKEVTACASARAAGALLERRVKRMIETELVTFGETEAKEEPDLIDLDNLDLTELVEPTDEEPYSILTADFREWIDNYSGPRFNFVNCDFPYSIGLHESGLYKTEAKDLKYDDSEEIYDELCSTLVYATEDVLSASCHVVFWFPMSKYQSTLRHFQANGFWVEPYPLIWAKSDKMGIIPDPTRGPRRIYETAFIMSLGDRKVVKSTVNAVWASSESRDKEHASQKSQPMLEDFFRMFVDEDSIVLDPTCGSGTALAAALTLGARSVTGLDINSECVRIAEDNCRMAHAMRVKE
jgi:ParB family chromosome partitioning protein